VTEPPVGPLLSMTNSESGLAGAAVLAISAGAPLAALSRVGAVLRWERERLARVTLVAIMLGGCWHLVAIMRQYRLGLLGDDFDFVLARPRITLHALLAPHNEHLSAVPVLLYRAVFALAGMRGWPYYGLLLCSLVACCTLSWVFAKRALGSWLALAVPLLLVTLGPAAEGLLWPIQMQVWTALAAFLGALLAIERRSRRGDAVACTLLLVAVGSHSLGVTLLPAAAVALAFGRDSRARVRRTWVVGVPLVLYAVWYAVYRPHSQRDLGRVPGFMTDSFKSTIEALTGLAAGDVANIVSIAVAVFVAEQLAWSVVQRVRAQRALPWLAVCGLVALLVVWVFNALDARPDRPASESRYQFHNVVLLLLVLLPLIPRLHLRPVGRTVAAALFASAAGYAVVSNLGGAFKPWEQAYAFHESIARAEFGAIELGRPAAVPGAMPIVAGEPGLLWPFSAADYYDAIDGHGSVVSVLRDLYQGTADARAQADRVLVRTEGIALRAAVGHPGSTPPTPLGGVRVVSAGRGCAELPQGSAQTGATILAAPGGVIVRPGQGQPVAVAAARFGTLTDVPLGAVFGASSAVVATNADNVTYGWRFVVTGAQAIVVCSLGT
jgi:hypothetical protein